MRKIDHHSRDRQGENMRGLRTGLRAAMIIAVLACVHGKPPSPPPETAVNLEPNDPRPIFSIAVSDDIEATLLQQQLGVEPLRVEGHTLYFYEAPGLLAKLADYGYTPSKQNSYGVYQRVVRVGKRGEEKELARFDVKLINRESDYWVVRGSLGALRALAAAGYRLTPLGTNEPRPRQVRIYASSFADVQRINALYVDIYSVSPEGKEQRGVVVTGGAFDSQIDDLIAEGFRVEVIEPVKKGSKP
jgi:hypothetical protein